MQETQTFNWMQYAPPAQRPVDVKVEPSYLEPSFSLISPPSSPSLAESASIPSAALPSSSSRRRSNTHSTSPKRARPYPETSPRERLRIGEPSRMSDSSFETWSPASAAPKGGSTRPNLSSERRSSDGDQQPAYSGAYEPPVSVLNMPQRLDSLTIFRSTRSLAACPSA